MKMQRRNASKRRGGFTIMMAVVLLGLASITFAAIGLVMATQVRRTRGMESGAQQRQLLLAGTQAVLAKLQAGQAVSEMSVPVPPGLEGATLTCAAAGATADEVTVEIKAAYRGSASRQTVKLAKERGVWRVREAVLAGGSQ